MYRLNLMLLKKKVNTMVIFPCVEVWTVKNRIYEVTLVDTELPIIVRSEGILKYLHPVLCRLIVKFMYPFLKVHRNRIEV